MPSIAAGSGTRSVPTTTAKPQKISLILLDFPILPIILNFNLRCRCIGDHWLSANMVINCGPEFPFDASLNLGQLNERQLEIDSRAVKTGQ